MFIITVMKAAQYNKYGGAEVIEINENAPKPTVSNDPREAFEYLKKGHPRGKVVVKIKEI